MRKLLGYAAFLLAAAAYTALVWISAARYFPTIFDSTNG
jgi:hypothetical protein